jgi:outer membrane protein assembly factor BamD (BamD/ComL family)
MTFLIAAALAVVCVYCASESKKLIKKGLYNCSSRLETAAKRMGKKNYTNAIRILDEIKYQCGGSEVMDTVYYYAANCHIGMKQYEDARNEFDNLYRE